MSEADVSLIGDEDVLRRMWQQTEDFGRKKEIRAHMYRLREQRLRSLYQPEPPRGKGPTVHHGSSFADQSFASLKSKEVRDAASPPHDYLRQDLKELSNAGWNVESENKTSDDGHTKIRSVHADIEGKYEVEGGRGRFAAAEQQTEAVSDYTEGATRVQRRRAAAAAASNEEVVRQTEDGTHFSSHKSSTTSSKFEEVSSTTREVPYPAEDCSTRQEARRIDNADFESRQSEIKQNSSKIERNVKQSEKIVSSSDKQVFLEGELVSKKVEYPEENLKVVTETRLLPDGSRVTSTRREYRPPAQHQQTSQTSQTRAENTYSTTERRSDVRESKKVVKESSDHGSRDVKETRRVDEYQDTTDFAKSNKRVEKSDVSNSKLIDEISTKNVDYHNAKNADYSTTRDESSTVRTDRRHDTEQTRRSQSNTRDDNQDIKQKRYIQDESTNRQDKNVEEVFEKKTVSDLYQTTYQADYQKKVSNDWSPSQQAWASSLRGDAPRSRGGSPSKDRYSSHSTVSESSKYDSRATSRSSISPDKSYRQRPSASPEKAPSFKPNVSPDRRSSRPPSVPREARPSASPDRRAPSRPSTDRGTSPAKSTDTSPPRASPNPDRRPAPHQPADTPRASASPDRKPGYMRPTAASAPRDTSPTKPSKLSQSPERKPYETRSTVLKAQEDHYKFVDEETKTFVRTDSKRSDIYRGTSSSPDRYSTPRESPSSKQAPPRDFTDHCRTHDGLNPAHVPF